MRHVPLAPASKLKPWMWNVHTCGSFALIGSFSVEPSWILTVPLFPGGSPQAEFAPAVAKNSRAMLNRIARYPAALRIRRIFSLPFSIGPVVRAPRKRGGCEHGSIHWGHLWVTTRPRFAHQSVTRVGGVSGR